MLRRMGADLRSHRRARNVSVLRAQPTDRTLTQPRMIDWLALAIGPPVTEDGSGQPRRGTPRVGWLCLQAERRPENAKNGEQRESVPGRRSLNPS